MVLKFLVSFILIAGFEQGEGAVVPDVPFALRGGYHGEQRIEARNDSLGPSLPDDTKYVPYTANKYILALSILKYLQLTASSLDECEAEARKRGAQVFELRSGNKCNIATLQFPLCRSWTGGSVPVYISEKYLASDTAEDSTDVKDLTIGDLLTKVITHPTTKYEIFRVTKPTILHYPGYYEPTGPGPVQWLFPTPEIVTKVNPNILTDPTCHTKKFCSTSFVRPKQSATQKYAHLSEYCGGLLAVYSGEELNVLSHEGIGCKNFTAANYPADGCMANYRGYPDVPLKLTVTYVNFVGDDACDGYDLNIVTYNTQQNITKTKVCQNPTGEIISPLPRGRIALKGSAITGRPKYGFIIKISYADVPKQG